MMDSLIAKLTSRKFWITVAAMLTSVAGFNASSSEKIQMVCIICGAVSAGIYAVCEALVDSVYVESDVETDISDDTEKEE